MGLLERVDALALIRENIARSLAMLEVCSFGALVVAADASRMPYLASLRLASRMPHSAGAGKVANASSQASSSFPSQVDVPMWEQYGAHLAEICKEVLAIRGRS
jgi:hypothetical protein